MRVSLMLIEAELRSKAMVLGKVEQPRMKDRAPAVIVAQPDGLHPVVQDFLRRAPIRGSAAAPATPGSR